MVQHLTQLLDVGFTGSVIDGGGTLGKDGCHDNIGRTSHRGLVEQHIVSLQLLGCDLIDITSLDTVELGTQLLETEEVGI